MSTRNHAERQHSSRGGSGFVRWSVCAPSCAASEGLPRRDTVYSKEGTRAHEILEACFVNTQEAWEYACGVDDEMVEGVQLALDTVRQDLEEYQIAFPDGPAPIVMFEKSFSMADLGFPDSYGSADVVIYFPAWHLLRVYDFKYGAGIVVEVENNGQLRFYAVGTLICSPEFQPTHIETVVIQPRCEHSDGYVRREKLELDELSAWAETELVPALRRTYDPVQPFVPGAHCRMCPVKDALACPALDIEMGHVAIISEGTKDAAAEVRQLTNEELFERLAKADIVKLYIAALRSEAETRLVQGKAQDSGWKVVPKKSDRQFVPEREIDGQKIKIEDAARMQFGDKAWTEPRLKSPAQIEKLKAGKDFVAGWAFKPDRGLTIAPNSDKRKAVSQRSAREIFAGVIERLDPLKA